jgi:acetolactate synthase-1/2/3 large subunit
VRSRDRLSTLKKAVQTATTAPTGPVSVEIPIDIQQALMAMPPTCRRCRWPCCSARAARRAGRAWPGRRPLLWLGGGARHAGAAVQRLKALGFGIVTTGRAAASWPRTTASLGAYNIHKPVEAFYQSCDAMLAVGTRLRSNETLKYELKLPRPLLRIDADAAQQGRCYADDGFVCGDAALALAGLADRLEARG